MRADSRSAQQPGYALECTTLEPRVASIDKMRSLLNQTAEIAAHYLETLDDRGVAPTPEALAQLAELNQPLQEDPQNPTAVIAMLDRIGSPATMGMAGRRYGRRRRKPLRVEIVKPGD